MNEEPLHPGGREMTLRLLGMAERHGLPPGKGLALDMGAGKGSTVKLLKELGWIAIGIDCETPSCAEQPDAPDPGNGMVRGDAKLVPEGGDTKLVPEGGDMLCTPFPDGRFDLVISECSFFLTEDVPGALREAGRILKNRGLLAVGDVHFGSPGEWREMLERHSFHVLELEDITALWREYYLESIWKGRAIAFCHGHGKDCRYFLTVARKEQPHG